MYSSTLRDAGILVLKTFSCDSHLLLLSIEGLGWVSFHANLNETLFCNSFSTNFQGTQELCVKGSQWIGEKNVVGVSYGTDLNQGNHIR
jgi:hypothetical protein